MKAKTQDKVFYSIMLLCSALVIGLLLLILGYIGYKGIGLIDWHFLTSDFESTTAYVDIADAENLGLEVEVAKYDSNDYIKIKSISSDSSAKSAICNEELWPIKAGDIIRKIGSTDTKGITIEEYNLIVSNLQGNIRLKVTRPGGGIFPLIINTFIMIGLSLLFSLPVSIFSAIYLAEYSKEGTFIRLVRFMTSSLAGIPSIIFGLFGMLIFVNYLNLGFSLFAGALTLSIVLLPTIITQTEEAIKRVPLTFREGSFALGATKLQTIFKVILPNALSGITVAILLSIGRIVAESAALILTAGTVARIPSSLLNGASTLTVRAYIIAKETGDIQLACALGIVTIVLIIVVNAAVGLTKKFDKMSKFN